MHEGRHTHAHEGHTHAAEDPTLAPGGGHPHAAADHEHTPGGHPHAAADHEHTPGGHPHAAAAENHSARPHPEFVVLEIGEGLGALIVHVDAELHGVEVEISRSGEDSRRSHKDVLQRSIGGKPAYTAVFDQLPEGTYTLWTAGAARERGVAIVGGTVQELDWRSAEVAV